jgi:hypothetical protein
MTKLGDELIESLMDALAHAKGKPSGVHVQTGKVSAARAIRRKPTKPAPLSRRNRP